MHDLTEHPFFERWTDPASGIESFVLTERVAPVQYSFYFTNPSVSADENWLWFVTLFPPNGQPSLGVVCLDPARPMFKHFPQAGFSSASPMVAPEGDAVYFCARNHVYKLALDGTTTIICTVPEEYIAGRHYSRIATHLTLSADGKYFLLDGDLGNFWWVGIGDIATGKVTILKEFPQHHDHAQFSPTDPKLFVIPEDWWHDRVTGQRFEYDHRLWLMDIDQTRYEPVRPKDWDMDHSANATHEWWSADGMLCWTDYSKGTYECNPCTLEATHVWKRALCHAHCSSDGRYWCADQNPYAWMWGDSTVQVLFFDRQLDRDTCIVSAMPKLPPETRWGRPDPHPQFSPKDSWVVYTTTVRGITDVALSPVRAAAKRL